MAFQPLSTSSHYLPRFENGQKIFAQHLNALTDFFQVLTLTHFSEPGQNGILRGLSLKVHEEVGQTTLSVSPGLAVNGDGQIIFLADEQRVVLPRESVRFSTAVLAITRQESEEIRTSDGGESLGLFGLHACQIGYASAEEVQGRSTLVEIARVACSPGGYLSDIRMPNLPLQPRLMELDERDAIWLGEMGVGFVRPVLQGQLASRAVKILSHLPIQSFTHALTLIPMPAFAQRGLLSRDQFTSFLNVLQKLRNERVLDLTSHSNAQLVDRFMEINVPEADELWLTRDQPSARIDLKARNGATIIIRYTPDRLPFTLRVQRDERNKQLQFHLDRYDTTINNMRVSHLWDKDPTRGWHDYAGGTPKSLDLYALQPNDRQHRDPFAQCLFREEGSVIRLELSKPNPDLWPRP